MDNRRRAGKSCDGLFVPIGYFDPIAMIIQRIIQFILFSFAACIGAVAVTLVSKATDAPEEVPKVLEQQQLEQQPPLDEPDFDKLVIREREHGERRAEVITSAADREPIDHDWAPDMQRQLAERFARNGPADSRLLSTTCKTSLCIVEVETASRMQAIGLQPWQQFFGLSRGFVTARVSEHDGEFRNVIFLARDGHSLPE
jgi:hypothetical protein